MNPDPRPQLPPVLPGLISLDDGSYQIPPKRVPAPPSPPDGMSWVLFERPWDFVGFSKVGAIYLDPHSEKPEWHKLHSRVIPLAGWKYLKPIALANGIGVVPEGLPPLPPVPEGYDRWEYRGAGWENDSPSHFMTLSRTRPDEGWLVGDKTSTMRAKGFLGLHYIEAAKDLPSAPVGEPTRDPCESVVKESLTTEAKPEAETALENELGDDPKYPRDYSFEAINDFVNCDVHFEELQGALLGMASHFENQSNELSQANAAVGALRDALEAMVDVTECGPKGMENMAELTGRVAYINKVRPIRHKAYQALERTPPAPEGWREISDNPPEDGTRVDLWGSEYLWEERRPADPGHRRFTDCQYILTGSPKDSRFMWRNSESGEIIPTHWMPLPKPPTGKEGGE